MLRQCFVGLLYCLLAHRGNNLLIHTAEFGGFKANTENTTQSNLAGSPVS